MNVCFAKLYGITFTQRQRNCIQKNILSPAQKNATNGIHSINLCSCAGCKVELKEASMPFFILNYYYHICPVFPRAKSPNPVNIPQHPSGFRHFFTVPSTILPLIYAAYGNACYDTKLSPSLLKECQGTWKTWLLIYSITRGSHLLYFIVLADWRFCLGTTCHKRCACSFYHSQAQADRGFKKPV